jgi:septum formation protein
MYSIILASASPRRKELLNQIGLNFEVQVSDVQEIIDQKTAPEKLAEKLAYNKALAVANKNPSKLVIGADTLVVNGSTILGKPKDEKKAYEMLFSLSNKKHQVMTGIAMMVQNANKVLIKHEITDVYFKNLSLDEINGYVLSTEPYDKAGGYGIQGLGACLVKKIDGCYFNVVGLPIYLVVDMFKFFDISVLGGKNVKF